MNRLNIRDATKEQLIGIIKQLRQDIQQLQNPSKAAEAALKNSEEQISQLQEIVRDANHEIDALRQHNTILTEKSANDEETINMLIKRFEEVGKDTKNLRHHTNGDPASPKHSALLGAQEKKKCASDGSPPLASPPPPNEVLHAGENGTPSAAAFASTAILASKNEEIAKLEAKVSELLEVNAFYSNIVSQQDEAEKIRQMRGATHKEVVERDSIEVSALKSHINNLMDQKSTLQKLVKQIEDERKLCLCENLKLREQCSSLEADILLLGRSQRAHQLTQSFSQTSFEANTTSIRRHPEMSAYANHGHHIGGGEALLRIPAQSVALSQANLKDEPISSSKGAPPPASSASPSLLQGGPPPSREGAHPRLDIHALGRLHIRQPTRQERALLERIDLYEAHLEKIQASEADRQNAFDEMERGRAELFTYMNEQLVRQRSEIQALEEAHRRLQKAFEDTRRAGAGRRFEPPPRSRCDVETETDDALFDICPAKHDEDEDNRRRSSNGEGRRLVDEMTSVTSHEAYHNAVRDLIYREEKERGEILLCSATTLLEDLIRWYQLWVPLCVLHTHNHVLEDRKMRTKDGVSPVEEKAPAGNPGFEINHTQGCLARLTDEDEDGAPAKLNQPPQIAFDFEKEIDAKCCSAFNILLSFYDNALSEYNKLAKACLDETTSIFSASGVDNDDDDDGDAACNEEDIRLVRNVLAEITKPFANEENTTQAPQVDVLNALFEGPPPSLPTINDIEITIEHSLPCSEMKEGCDVVSVLPPNNETLLNLKDLPIGEASGNSSVEEKGGSVGSRSNCSSVKERKKASLLSVSKSSSDQYVRATHSGGISSAESILIAPANYTDLIPQPLIAIPPTPCQQEAVMENECGTTFPESNPTHQSEANDKGDAKDFRDAQGGIDSEFYSKAISSCISSQINLQVNASDGAFHTSLPNVLPVETETSHISQPRCSSHFDAPPQECNSHEIRTRMEGSDMGENVWTTSVNATKMPLQNSSLSTSLDPDSKVDKTTPLKAAISVKDEKPSPPPFPTPPARKEEFIEASYGTDDTDDTNFEAGFDPFA